MQALGATWSNATVTKFAGVVADEVRETGQNVLLAPDADIIRQPWWGRANETESEDPTVNANITGRYTQVVQSKKVIANLKHYAGYNQETNRSNGQNDVIGQRALREVYTLAFDSVIKQRERRLGYVFVQPDQRGVLVRERGHAASPPQAASSGSMGL